MKPHATKEGHTRHAHLGAGRQTCCSALGTGIVNDGWSGRATVLSGVTDVVRLGLRRDVRGATRQHYEWRDQTAL